MHSICRGDMKIALGIFNIHHMCVKENEANVIKAQLSLHSISNDMWDR